MWNNPKIHLVSINAAFVMHVQYLVKFCQFVLKILSRNNIMTDGGKDVGTDGRNVEQSRSSIAPLFQSRAIMILLFLVATTINLCGKQIAWLYIVYRLTPLNAKRTDNFRSR